MDTAESQERNLHTEISNNLTAHTGETYQPQAVKPVMDAPAVVHEEAKPPSHETPFEEYMEGTSILGFDLKKGKDRITNNGGPRGPLAVVMDRVKSLKSLRGSDDSGAA